LNDSGALTYVLNQLDSSKCSLSPLKTDDLKNRAGEMIDNAVGMGVPRVIKSSHVVTNNVKVNTLFCSYIFNTKHGLIPDEGVELLPFIEPPEEEGSEEEKQFRVWLNSLDLKDQDIITNLYDDIKSGILLCRVVDKMNPGAISWKLVKDPPRHEFDMNGNCEHGVKMIQDKDKGLGLKLIAVNGAGLAKGVPIDTLATIWCLCKESYKRIIKGQSDKDIVDWANGLAAGKNLDGKGELAAITGFKDKSLKDSRFLMHILADIDSRVVRWDWMEAGDGEDALRINAKVFIEAARKLGALIFCVWEQITTLHMK